MSKRRAAAQADMDDERDRRRLTGVWEEALASEGVDLTTDGLIKVLGSDRIHLRTGAAILLGRRGRVEAIPHLRPLLADEIPTVRVEAAMSLVLLGDTSGTCVLIEALEAPLVTPAPLTAAGYLAALGDPRGYGTVLQGLRSNLAGIRLMAAVALKGFLRYHGRDIAGQKVDLVSKFEEALSDSDPLVRREILHKAGALDDPRVPALLSRVHEADPDQEVRQTAAELLSAWSGRLKRAQREGEQVGGAVGGQKMDAEDRKGRRRRRIPVRTERA